MHMVASFTFSTRSIFFLSVAAALFGCERYAVTLNQQPVYTPPPLYSDFAVADLALRDCIKQTIIDSKVTRVEQLTALTCRHAGLTSLAGLEHFAFLQELDLSHNQLLDARVLAKLPQLKALKIQENPALRCDTLVELAQTEVHITAPAHCPQNSGD
jgi:hypothetical protein